MSGNGLTDEQITQLSEVFRAEAKGHIKTIAEVLFSMEDVRGTSLEETLNLAFREAHSLKGSAATLGFSRVSTLAHRFEDALGTLRNQQSHPTRTQLEALLHTLEVIRQAVISSTPGETTLTERESSVLNRLHTTFQLTDTDTEGSGTATDTAYAATSPLKKDPVAPSTKRRRDEMVRVSEKRIDEVILQFGELFDTGLQIESLGFDLKTNRQESDRLTAGLFALLEKLDGSNLEEDAIELLDISRNLKILSQLATTNFEAQHKELQKHITRCQDALLTLRIAPLSSLQLMIRNQVHETSAKTGKQVSFHFSGGETTVDRAILNAMEKPLIHLIRNAMDHGIESPEDRKKSGKPEAGCLKMTGRHMGDSIQITIEDDGRGIDPDQIRAALMKNYNMDPATAADLSSERLFDYLFEPGFSTSQKVSQISGRGVGLDVVKYTIEHLGGEVSVRSTAGEGARFVLYLPLTISSIKCLLFETSGQTLAIPAANVVRVMVAKPDQIRPLGGGQILVLDDEQLSLTTMHEVLTLSKTDDTEQSHLRFVTILRVGDRKFAFGVDNILEYTQLVVKPLGDLLERVPNVSGLALLGTGKLCLVLNPGDIIRNATGAHSEKDALPRNTASGKTTTILVVDDSIAIRTMQQTILESEGYNVLTAANGLKALQVMGHHSVDLVLTDIQMPEMDGFELTRALKSRNKTRQIPVVLITSLGSNADIATGLAAGADAHITKKHLTRTELLNTIQQLL